MPTTESLGDVSATFRQRGAVGLSAGGKRDDRQIAARSRQDMDGKKKCRNGLGRQCRRFSKSNPKHSNERVRFGRSSSSALRIAVVPASVASWCWINDTLSQ